MSSRTWWVILAMCVSSCSDVEPSGYVTEVSEGCIFKAPYTFIDTNSEQINIQLAGVACDDLDSDDLKTAYLGAKARHFSAQWLKQRVILERPVQDGSGRPLRRWVFIKASQSGEYLHEALLREGLAFEAISGHDLGEAAVRIRTLEQEARAKRVGRWSAEQPSDGQMAEWVSSQRSLLGGIMSAFAPSTPSTPSKTADPVPQPQPQPPSQSGTPTPTPSALPALPATASLEGAKVVTQVDALAKSAREKFLAWQALDAAARVQGCTALRGELRNVKIAVMDALDDSTQLDAVQRAYLDTIREDMNRVIKILDAVKP